MSDHIDLIQRTRAWIEGDPDPANRRDLESLLDEGRWDELGERMNGVLEFGTAGIRGAVEAGSNRMNRAVVIRTTAGLSAFLRENRSGPVVVGFDGRSSSRQFAEDTVGVLVAAGHEVAFFNTPVPTPMVAFAARRLGAGGAVVVTASHNPPADNGYKVYDHNGAQIVPPADVAIASAIAEVGSAAKVPRTEAAMGGNVPAASALDLDEMYAAYREEVDQVRTRTTGGELRVAYTPIHGVGWEIMRRLTADSGYADFHVVEAQRDPDGRFPTVAFPNPEEPGAMDLVKELGERIGADLVIANDPDADRLAVVLPENGRWRPLTGNQTGVLMADWLLEHWDSEERPIVVNSIVSSPMLSAVGELYGAHVEQTLTGFKWIANAAMDLEEQGAGRFVFGYEEALGYSVGPVVRDKDGMSAAIVFMDMAQSLAESDQTVGDRLADLYRRAGLWASTQLSIMRPGSAGVEEIMAAMDRLGERFPSELAGHAVVGGTDYRAGAEERPRWLAATPLVALDLEDRGRVLVRPSGTEPKLKIYVDLRGEAGDDVETAEARLREVADEIAAATAGFIGL